MIPPRRLDRAEAGEVRVVGNVIGNLEQRLEILLAGDKSHASPTSSNPERSGQRSSLSKAQHEGRTLLSVREKYTESQRTDR